MNPNYFDTYFETPVVWTNRAAQFAIITAWATTGEVWTGEENRAANTQLEAELCSLDCWMQPVTGYSPTTGHAEPGWAVAVALDEALRLGRQYKQDAIYYVEGDTLTVSLCDGGDSMFVGPFTKRLTLAQGPSRA